MKVETPAQKLKRVEEIVRKYLDEFEDRSHHGIHELAELLGIKPKTESEPPCKTNRELHPEEFGA